MNAKKLVKEYERQLRADPQNLVIRLKLAAALREIGRAGDAVAVYHSVAVAYYQQGRLAQAIAVCRSVLEIEPAQRETQVLLAQLDAARAAQVAAAPPEALAPPPRAGTPVQGVPIAPPNAKTIMAQAAPARPLQPTQIMQAPPSNAGAMQRPAFFTPQTTPTPARLPLPPDTPEIGTTVPGRKQRVATSPPTPLPMTPPPLPPPDAGGGYEEEDDGLTIPTFSPARPRIRTDVQAEPDPEDPHGSATRIADSLAEAAEALAATDDDPVSDDSDEVSLDGDEPVWDDPAGPNFATPPPSGLGETTLPGAAPSSGAALPADLHAFTRSQRLLDVPPWPDAGPAALPDEEGIATPPAGATVAGHKQRPTTTLRGASPPAGRPPAPVAPAAEPPKEVDDDLALAQAFDRPFQASVDALAPDGSTIEQPLAVFRALPPDAMRELQRRVIIRRVGAGTVVVREGDPGEACYIVQAGCVRVLKHDPQSASGDHIEVARLGPGALFGEFALLADRRRHATVQAIEATELFEIPRRLLRELSARHADVGPALERLYRERLVSTLLATAPFFRPLPEEQRGALMSRFDPIRVEDGAPVIREGTAGGGLYLVVLGSVDITKDQGGKPVLLATLGEGAYFGEMSLLRGSRASATVTARGPVELAQLPPREFYAIVSEHPVLWDELRREAQRRELMTQNILAGDTNVV